jgi:hypothetical protein
MFSLFNKNNEIGIRFSKEVQNKYFGEYETTIYKSYGATMKGYILIPEKMWKESAKIVQLLNESFDYVMTLDAK